MFDFLDLFVTLSEKPTRWNWFNWVIWGIALVFVALFAIGYGLVGLHYVIGWPPL